VPSDASAQRLRIGAEVRRLRQLAGLSGEQVADALGWSQPKVSRIEAGRTAFTVRDVASLLSLYGVGDDVKAELLGATALDTGEGAWIVRAGGYPRRQGSLASLEVVTKRLRHYQIITVPGLLQTRDYARDITAAAGVPDPEASADARMERQAVVRGDGGPQYDVVIDARALLLVPGSVEVLQDQVLSLAEAAGQRDRLDIRVVPLGARSTVFATVGFMLFDFIAAESPSVAFVEAPTGDVYFSAEEDIARYSELFAGLQGVALNPDQSVEYLRSFAADIERYVGPVEGRSGTA
jgi:transcriptional regulator with XRE-family HTH domain